MSNKVTQAQRVVRYMETHGSITPLDAFSNLGITRLAARVFELRRDGFTISMEIEALPNRFGEDCHPARYRIEHYPAKADENGQFQIGLKEE